MSALFESKPMLVAFAASMGIVFVLLSIGYYLNIIIAFIWGINVVSDEYDDLLSSRKNSSKLRSSTNSSESRSLLPKASPSPVDTLQSGKIDRMPEGHRLPVIVFKSHHLMPSPDKELELLDTFSQLLSVGIVLTLHTTKGPREIRFYFIGDELKWESVETKSTSKRYRMKLRDVVSIHKGKQTHNLKCVVSAVDSLCLSLVTERTSLDLEATSELERDCLLKGFTMKLRDIRQPAF